MDTQRLLPAELAGYRLEEELGRGGFSVVYRARDLSTGREVALKLFMGGTESALERFRREPEALARAGGHPNVVQFIAAREHDEKPFFVMELVRGRSLEQLLLERAPLPWPEACTIAVKLARALVHLHSWEIVHRDLKPANVIMDETTGEPRLVDFGIALDTTRVTRMSRTGDLVGTPLFMSPEQLRGRVNEVGPATDVYGLGAVLYEMLTGAPPFGASDFEGLLDAVEKGPVSPERLAPGIPPEVAAICMRALASRPSARYPTAAELEKALSGVLSSASQDAQAWSKPRVLIPPYEVQGEVGRGGMGVVYRALAPDGRTVAIKVLRVNDPEMLARFERERRVIASLSESEGFVPLLEAGRAPRGPYLVMPFIEGGSLADRLKRGPLAVDVALLLGRALAAALSHAHGRGIVHRDLKPENILFTGDGRPLVADLGLAKHFQRNVPGASGSMTLSRTGAFLGTVGYTAPEQLRDAKAAGPPADVFGLGAILYECLAGRPAFLGDATEMIARITAGRFEPLLRARPETFPWFVAAVERALAPDPRNRFEDGAALFHALRGKRLDDAETAIAPPASTLPAPRRRMKELLIGAGSLVLLLAAGIGLAALASELGAPEQPASSATRSPSPRPTAHVGVATSTARAASSPAPGAGASEALRGLLDSPTAKLEAAFGSYDWKAATMINSVAATPDGKHVLTGTLDGLATLWDVSTGAWVRHFQGGPRVLVLAVSPDGRLGFLGSDDKTMRVYELATGRARDTLLGPAIPHRVQPFRDGRRVLLCGSGNDIFDLENARPLSSVAGVSCAVSSDGRFALAGTADGMLVLSSLETGETIRTVRANEGPISFVDISEDGRVAVSQSDAETLKLWDVVSLIGGADAALGTVQHPQLMQAALSPDGTRLVTASRDFTLKVWDTGSARELRTLTGHTGWVMAVAFLPDGKRAVSGGNDGTVRLWDVEKGVELSKHAGHAGPVYGASFTPDGKRVVSVGFDDTLRTWDAASGKELACATPSLDPKGAQGTALAVSSNGRLALTGSTSSVVLWDLGATPQQAPTEVTALRSTAPVTAVAFAPRNKLALWGTRDGTVTVWDLERGSQVRSFRAHEGPVWWLASLRDGSVASAEERGQLVVTGVDGTSHVAISLKADGWAGTPNGARVLSVAGQIKVWDLKSEAEVGALPAQDAIGAAFSADGSRIVSAHKGGAVRVSDVTTKREIARVDLSKVADPPTQVAFTNDGRAFLVGTQRGMILKFVLSTP